MSGKNKTKGNRLIIFKKEQPASVIFNFKTNKYLLSLLSRNYLLCLVLYDYLLTLNCFLTIWFKIKSAVHYRFVELNYFIMYLYIMNYMMYMKYQKSQLLIFNTEMQTK